MIKAFNGDHETKALYNCDTCIHQVCGVLEVPVFTEVFLAALCRVRERRQRDESRGVKLSPQGHRGFWCHSQDQNR